MDNECIEKINDSIKSWNKLGFNAEDMMDHRRSKFEQIIKIIKVNDDIQAGKVELAKISNDEIKKYKITEDDLSMLYLPNKEAEVIRSKMEKYLMDYYGNVEIKDDKMLMKYHELINKGGISTNVLEALAGAEGIDSERYESVYKVLGNKATQKDIEKFEAKRLEDLKKWVADAKANGYSNVTVSVGDHEVLFKSFDEKTGTVICYDPLRMNKERVFIIDNVIGLTGIKLPPTK